MVRVQSLSLWLHTDGVRGRPPIREDRPCPFESFGSARLPDHPGPPCQPSLAPGSLLHTLCLPPSPCRSSSG